MRILFLAHRLPYPPDKGDKTRSFFEVKCLSQQHQVDLFCFFDLAEDARHVDALRRKCHSVYAEYLPFARRQLHSIIELSKGKPFSQGYFYSRSMMRRIREALQRNHYDLIFVFCSSMAQYVEEITGIPKILDMVDVDSRKWSALGEHCSAPGAWLWKREARALADCEQRLVEAFSLTLVSTPREAAALTRSGAGMKIAVLDNSVDANYWNPAAVSVSDEIRMHQPFIVFTGSMDYLPNADAAVYFCRQCLPTLRILVPGIRFVIAGRNPPLRVKRLAGDPAVVVTGAVADVRPFLRGGIASVAPLRLAFGVQNKVLEAMCMGLPVVTTSKVAASLPASVSSRLLVEDDPTRMAGCLAKLAAEGPPIEPGCIRSTVLEAFGSGRVQRELESIVRSVVEAARPVCMAGSAELRVLDRPAAHGGMQS